MVYFKQKEIMLETIKHLTGMCGESHINLITITLIFILVKILLNKKYNDKKLY
tara:strand:- start:4105 stop:4263 length:159 start_codon:yes stop_codon:yes gene_type:complete